jgi:Ca2+-binding EF-hand superfamily protein
MAISGIGSSTNIQKAADNLFAKIDTKNQGYIDASELQTAFSQISSDGQGTPTDASNFLSQVDANGDGKVTKQELTDSMQKVADQLHAQFSASRISAAQGGSQQPSVDDIFSSLDTKNQGYLDKSELQAAFDQNSTDTTANAQKVDQIFKTLDTNGDGQISKDEMSAGINQLASQGGTGSTQTAAAPQHVGNAAAAHAHRSGGGDKSSSSSDASSTTYAAADTNQDGTVSLQELLAYQGVQTSGSGTGDTSQTNSQNSLDAVMKIVDQLAQTYGQFNQDSSAAVDATSGISEIA